MSAAIVAVTGLALGGAYMSYESGRRQKSMMEDASKQTAYQSQQAAEQAEVGKEYTLEQLKQKDDIHKKIDEKIAIIKNKLKKL